MRSATVQAIFFSFKNKNKKKQRANINTKYNYKSQTQNTKYKTQLQKKYKRRTSTGLLFLANKSLSDLPPFYTTIYIVDFFERTLHNIWYFVERKERTDFCDH